MIKRLPFFIKMNEPHRATDNELEIYQYEADGDKQDYVYLTEEEAIAHIVSEYFKE